MFVVFLFSASIALILAIFLPGTRYFLEEVLLPFTTIAAIAIGGMFALFKTQMFRHMEPHLTIKHTVSHRMINDRYAHIAVSMDLTNNSRVIVRVKDAVYFLFRVAPYTEPCAEVKSERREVNGKEDYINWDPILIVFGPVEGRELRIEPGELHQETVEFMFKNPVKDPVETVLISTRFCNANFKPGSDSALYWDARTAYDLGPNAQAEAGVSQTGSSQAA